MYTGKLIFSQVMEHIPLPAFHRSVDRYSGNYKIKDFTCLDQYLCMNKSTKYEQCLTWAPKQWGIEVYEA